LSRQICPLTPPWLFPKSTCRYLTNEINSRIAQLQHNIRMDLKVTRWEAVD
jgi:hypothetical protein